MTAEAPAKCLVFHYIGQSITSCDACGRPSWEHMADHVFIGGPFDGYVAVRLRKRSQIPGSPRMPRHVARRRVRLTHECMNDDGQMVEVGRPQQWGIYFDDDRSPTLRARDRGFPTEEDAREALRFIEANIPHPASREYRVVAICQPSPGAWKICGGREAVLPSKRPDPWSPGGVQVGRP